MRLRSTDVSARTIGGETIVLDLRSARYLTVTGAGVRLLELLGSDRSLDELVGTVVEEYDVDPLVARRDTDDFLEQLRSAGLLQG